jgi:hypothetical protein
MRKADKIVVEKHERTRQIGRPMGKWEDNIKMDLQEIGIESVD